MTTTRRSFIKSGSLFLTATGSFASIVLSAAPTNARASKRCSAHPGYGALVPDPAGILDLPAGFSYRLLSASGEALSDGGVVPSSHDGMAAFSAGARGTYLVRNHELNPEDVAEAALVPVAALAGATYDAAGVGGTTTLLVTSNRELVRHGISLAGTVDNCAGGPTPWRTWLSCEETLEVLDKPHGYVFEVDPRRGGNPEPIIAMGRFAHEAVSFDRRGRAYLTEDASAPFGCIYRFTPNSPLAGRGSLHAGGLLETLAVNSVDTDLSIVTEPGTRLGVSWIKVPNPNPLGSETSVREQSIALGATPIKKAEGTWLDHDGSIWFVSSYAGGPLAEDPEDVTAVAHAGQIWRYEPRSETLELIVLLPPGSPHDGPDNITAGPHGFALACTDGEDAQYLIGIDEAGHVFPFAFNAGGTDEFAGATFSPDGSTLYVNIQGEPAFTLAIWGPWHEPRRR
jgi:secreted PhoX family phosphatase